jgi:membrane protease YdiL (CAAX protease family)
MGLVVLAVATIGSSSVLGVTAGPLAVAVVVGGRIVVTALAGVGFAWLRFRGDSIVAPTLAHWGLNGAAYAAGWLIVRNAWA